jgi:hypothetical protein
MSQKKNESQVILALQAMQHGPKLSGRGAARIYSVDPRKLQRRMRGMLIRRDIPVNSRKLTDLEESAIFQHIFDLDSRSSHPRLSSVEDMANILLAKRNASRVEQR